jgi:hypothetical protein
MFDSQSRVEVKTVYMLFLQDNEEGKHLWQCSVDILSGRMEQLLLPPRPGSFPSDETVAAHLQPAWKVKDFT